MPWKQSVGLGLGRALPSLLLVHLVPPEARSRKLQPEAGSRGRFLLCLPGCCGPTPTGSHVGSGISYLLRSQILRGEKCPQQAVPVTKELPNKRRAESGRACQNLWRRWRNSCKCSAPSRGWGGVGGITQWKQDEKGDEGGSEKLQEDNWKARRGRQPSRGPAGVRTAELTTQKGLRVSAHQKSTSLPGQPSGQGRAGRSGCRKGPRKQALVGFRKKMLRPEVRVVGGHC